MKSDSIQVLALAGIMLAAIILGVISWSMIPDSRQPGQDDTSPQSGDTINNDTDASESQPTPIASEPSPQAVEPSPGDIEDTYDESETTYTGVMPSSVVKWTDAKLGSELCSNGSAVWNQLITSTIDARVGYNRLCWDNVFYDNQFGGGNVRLQVTWAFTDGDGSDYQRNKDGIGYHGTWAPTSTTWAVTSGTWNKRWTLGVTHGYTSDFLQNGANTDTYGLHYRTYE